MPIEPLRSVQATGLIDNRWDPALASTLSPEQLLLYRSNLLGADKRVTNFGGGNTSAKLAVPDPLLGHPVQVLWVKGSGGDIGTLGLDGFATLYMDKLLALRRCIRVPRMKTVWSDCIRIVRSI